VSAVLAGVLCWASRDPAVSAILRPRHAIPFEPWSIAQGLAGVGYGVGQTGLLAYASHRWALLGADPTPPPVPAPWWASGDEPCVLVQLPVRDEPEVVARVVEAVSRLDWPRERLTVQLLDDSGPEAAALGAAAVAEAASRGLRITQLRRGHRHGFKAGALAYGLVHDDAPFVAVFDADFVPPPDFLRRLLPHFAQAGVGLVQARWGHLNRDASLLTRAQAVLLDAHLLVEHIARQDAGRFFNFNGTAGIWRRDCIEDAGGWAHDTLTEDLDLSYRAQLRGWRFVYDPSVVVPSELPADMRAFRMQQHRWVKGALQTARKLLATVWAAPLSLRTRIEATVHLTANLVHPFLITLVLLMAPVLIGPTRWSESLMLAAQVAFFVVGTLPVILFLALGQWRAGRRGARLCADVGLALLLCGGLAWWLTRAVLEGLLGATGEFVRTPKAGEARVARTSGAALAGNLELAGAAICLVLAVLAVHLTRPEATPFLLAFAAGSLWVGLGLRRDSGA
jgi:cellulose synthase/poly-beta-1,6-N-acetylglucosamine synthase-like glycosyltransferase